MKFRTTDIQQLFSHAPAASIIYETLHSPNDVPRNYRNNITYLLFDRLFQQSYSFKVYNIHVWHVLHSSSICSTIATIPRITLSIRCNSSSRKGKNTRLAVKSDTWILQSISENVMRQSDSAKAESWVHLVVILTCRSISAQKTFKSSI